MNQELTGALQEQIKKLPPEVQDAIASPDLRKKIGEVGSKNKLHIDQIGLLEDEVLLVMIGLEETTNFVKNLTDHVKVDATLAEHVMNDVTQQIFLPIRDAMKKFMEVDSTPPSPKNPPAVAKSVVMPSSMSAPAKLATPMAPAVPISTSPTPNKPAVTASVPPPPMKSAAPVVPIAPKPPVVAADLHPAQVMLTEKTVQIAPSAQNLASPPKPEPPKPQDYKADPYREPVEP